MRITIHVGHVLDKLALLPAASVHAVWTSPPYWGLREYKTEPQVWGGDAACAHLFNVEIAGEKPTRALRGASSQFADRSVSAAQVAGRHAGRGAFCARCGAWRGEHGLEPTLDLWLKHEVAIFRAVGRVLRDDGTLWLNVGDAYSTHPAGWSAARYKEAEADDRAFRDKPELRSDLPEKNRLMLPARLVIALQGDGWFLRDEVVWHKPNPMPSSVRDRTTPAHEMLYLLSKRARYYFDAVAIDEPATYAGPNAPDKIKSPYGQGFARRAKSGNLARKTGAERGRDDSNLGGSVPWEGTKRNKRSVWTIATEPMKEAHFATAPTALVEPCIKTSTSERGVCPDCGAPWARVAARTFVPQPDAPGSAERTADQTAPETRRAGSERGFIVTATLGWHPTCACYGVTLEPYPTRAKGMPLDRWKAACVEIDAMRQRQCEQAAQLPTVPAVVLDPFGGSGTTALVANRLQRDAVLVELQRDYVDIALARLRGECGMLTKIEVMP